jgi:hypothetical protein
MARPSGCIAAAAILGLTVSAASAQTTGLRPALTSTAGTPQFQQAKLTAGAIRGTVLDDRGVPLGDAMVSALSPLSSRMVTTDARGHFRIDALPTGVYVLRIHRNGFMSARREGVRVNASGVNTDVDAIRLRRDEGAPGARPILTAGLDAPGGDSTSGDSGDNHSEIAWRLRHIKRSVLKDDGAVLGRGQPADDLRGARRIDPPARLHPARRCVFVDRRARRVGTLGRARVDESVGCVCVDPRRFVHVA